FELETPTASRVTMDAATSRDSVAAFMQDVLAGSGWEVSKIRRRSTRLEPPDSYWALFSVDINKDEEERNLRLVTKGALNDEAWDRLSARLARDGNGKVCDPVDGLWEAAARYPGMLSLPRPLGFNEEMGLLLEEGVRGRPVGGNRGKTEFMMAGGAAADALAVIHESGVEADQIIKIEYELNRLERVVQQFAYVLPVGHFLLKDLVTHMRDRVRKVEQEEWL